MICFRTRVFLLLSLIVAAARPQTAAAQTPLDSLRSEVRKLLAIQCAPETPPSVREANAAMLERRRVSLTLLLEQQLAELRAYPQRTGITLSDEDRKDLVRVAAPLEAELSSLRQPLAAVCSEPPVSLSGSEPARSAGPSESALMAVPASYVKPTVTQPPASLDRTVPAQSQSQKPAPPTAAPAAQENPATAAKDPKTQKQEAAEAAKSAKAETEAKAEKDVAAATNLAWHSMFTRAVAGIDISGASSFPTQQKVFLEFNLNAPLGRLTPKSQQKIVDAQTCVNRLTAAGSKRFDKDGNATALIANADVKETKDQCNNVGDVTSIDTLSADVTKEKYDALLGQAKHALHQEIDPTVHRTWVWLNPRISSLPQQTADLLTGITSSNPSFNSLVKSNFNQVVQGFEMVGGMEYLLLRPRNAIAFGNAHLSLSAIAGAGFTTPFAATSANAQEYNVSSNLTPTQIRQVFSLKPGNPLPTLCAPGTSPTASAPCTNVVAFVPPDRTRFYSQYYGGFRLKTFFFKTGGKDDEFGSLCEDREVGDICPVFPGIFEVAVGQNASVSGGRLRGMVLRNEAFYPLPFAPSFHLFFTSWVHLGGHNFTQAPVVLDNTSPPVVLSTLGVTVLPNEVQNRDYYRLGLGVDLVNLISSVSKHKQDDAATKKKADEAQTAIKEKKDAQAENATLKDANTRLDQQKKDLEKQNEELKNAPSPPPNPR